MIYLFICVCGLFVFFVFFNLIISGCNEISKSCADFMRQESTGPQLGWGRRHLVSDRKTLFRH